MQHPFSLAAEGAKVPDSISIPTTTLTLTQKVSLSSDTQGALDIICMPTLANYAWSLRSNLSGSGVYNAKVGAAGGGVTVVGNAGAFDINAMGNAYQRHRIVGWGIRVRGVSGLSTSGEFIAAPYAAKGLAPATDGYQPAVNLIGSGVVSFPNYVGTAGPADTAEAYVRALGVPYTGTANGVTMDAAKLASLAHHGVASQAQNAARGLHFRSFPFEPSAHEFRNVAFSSLGTDSIDTVSTLSAATYSQQLSVNMDPWRVGGFESIFIAATGLPASTTVGTLEVIFHLEAIVNPNLAMLARAACRPSPVIPTEYDKVRQAIARVAHVSFADAVQQGEDYVLGQVEGAVSKYAGAGLASLGGMLTRLMAAGA